MIPDSCRSGGIGRRSGFKIRRGNPSCEFESHLRHNQLDLALRARVERLPGAADSDASAVRPRLILQPRQSAWKLHPTPWRLLEQAVRGQQAHAEEPQQDQAPLLRTEREISGGLRRPGSGAAFGLLDQALLCLEGLEPAAQQRQL